MSKDFGLKEEPSKPSVTASFEPSYALNGVASYKVSSTPAPEKRVKSGLAVTALVLGILGVLGSWVPLLGILGGVLALIGLIVGIVALIKVKRGTAGGKGIAIAGVMLNVLAIIVATIVTIVLITWYGKIQHCVDTSEKDSNGTVICHVDGRNFSVNTRGGIVVHEIP